MPDERPIYEEVLDYLVYAPLGLAIGLAEELPRYIDRGRRRFESRFVVARFVGKSSVGFARRRVEHLLRDAVGERTAPEPAVGTERHAASPPSEAGKGPAAPTGAAGHLAIPGYESLAASQVVARLAGLSPDELRAVRDYERGHRRRRTILSRADQLLEEGPDVVS